MPLFKPGQFAHLKPERTAKYTIPNVRIVDDEPIVLELKFAGESNGRWQSAVMKAPPATGTEKTKQWASLLAHHVIVGWTGVVGVDGKPIACSSKAVEEFLHQLIDESGTGLHFIMPLLSFAGDPSNFREPAASAADLGNE
jgi:hypothetical protein